MAAPIPKTTENTPSRPHFALPRKALEQPQTARQTGIFLVTQPQQLNLFSGTVEIDVAALDRKIEESPANPWANSTKTAYDSDWKAFEAFCRKLDKESLPASAQTVMRYLRWETERGLAAGTISRRLTAIDNRHVQAGVASPKNYAVGLVMKNIRRDLGTAPKPKAPVLLPDLAAMLDQTGAGTRGLRDRAILLLGFGSGCRRSELAALNLGDVTSVPQGVVVRIVRGKTDQEGKGREVSVHRGKHKATDPARALEKWIAARGDSPGPLFSRVIRDQVTNQRLSPRVVARVVKRTARRAGLDPTRYAGHSLRSGCATTAAELGADVLTIARHLGHASTATTEKYIRPAERWKTNLLKGAL